MKRRIFIFASVLLGVVCLALGIAACDGDKHTAHTYGPWETTAATCEEAGERYRVCTVCGERDSEPIAPLGHDFNLGTVTTSPTCEGPGVRTRVCNRCQKEQEEPVAPLGHDWIEGEVITPAACEKEGLGKFECAVCGKTDEHAIPALEHQWEKIGVGKEPTCEEAGTRNVRCALCQKEETQTLPATGHDWVQQSVVTPAGCETEGRGKFQCAVCSKEEEHAIPALGHSWEGDYTVDKEATFEAAGEKSYHCSRCEARNGVTEIPKLEEGVPILYEIRLMRNNGERLSSSGATIVVSHADGTAAAMSNPSTFSAGVFRTNLVPETYTVEVINLPDGYTAEGKVTMEAGHPYCDLYVTAAPLSSPAPANTRYGVGSVMHDFTLRAANGNSYTLSRLLAQKRAVVLNFWYDGCGPCATEFPYLERAYQKYKDKLEILAITEKAEDVDAAVVAYANSMSLTFPMVSVDSWIGLESMFGVTSVPTTVVIDAEGVVAEVHVGSSTQQYFETTFEKYTSDSYWKRGHTAAAATMSAGEYALLPFKHENQTSETL